MHRIQLSNIRFDRLGFLKKCDCPDVRKTGHNFLRMEMRKQVKIKGCTRQVEIRRYTLFGLINSERHNPVNQCLVYLFSQR